MNCFKAIILAECSDGASWLATKYSECPVRMPYPHKVIAFHCTNLICILAVMCSATESSWPLPSPWQRAYKPPTIGLTTATAVLLWSDCRLQGEPSSASAVPSPRWMLWCKCRIMRSAGRGLSGGQPASPKTLISLDQEIKPPSL